MKTQKDSVSRQPLLVIFLNGFILWSGLRVGNLDLLIIFHFGFCWSHEIILGARLTNHTLAVDSKQYYIKSIAYLSRSVPLIDQIPFHAPILLASSCPVRHQYFVSPYLQFVVIDCYKDYLLLRKYQRAVNTGLITPFSVLPHRPGGYQ